MNKGGLLAAFLMVATVAMIVVGTVWPAPSALAYAGDQHLFQSSSTPEEAVTSLGEAIREQAWGKAYSSLANKATFTEAHFQHDLTGYYPSLTISTFGHCILPPVMRTSSSSCTGPQSLGSLPLAESFT